MSIAAGQIKKLVAEVDVDELAIRVIEAMGGVTRPPGTLNAAILAATSPDTVRGARAVAMAALGYISECFSNATRTQ